jgi:glutamate formiminotransferase/formiminotetrahydrofolate cyclodeaminase
MPTPLVECVPNFSEGRRAEVIQAIVAAIQGAPIRLLDVSSDKDHNRTVVTFVGTPDAVEQAAFAGIKTAAALIDLDQHRGEHPRLGAADVVPFIPIRDVTMETCIAIAQRLGQRVAEELGVPVYLYEAAATRPERENLENIRRGEYEALKAAIQTDPARAPDFGPRVLPSAGATVIGARPPLIAFNVYLTTDNVEIAKKIAKAMRMSSGGFRYVKALGLLVDGKAQISMNLTNYEKTPLHRVVEAIRREATRYGVGVLYTELVGLMPDAALIDAARWYLQLDLFDDSQLLERKLQAASLSPTLPAAEAQASSPGPDLRGATFAGTVAAGTATPGGGAVAALAGALAAALTEMVARLTLGKKKYVAVEAEMSSIAATAEGLRGRLLDAVEQDSAAYTSVMSAYKLDAIHPKRDQSIQVALVRAAEVPLSVMQLCIEALKLALVVVEKGNINAVTDAAVAGHMARAAAEGAALNVLVNVKSLTDPAEATRLREAALPVLDAARSISTEVIALAETRAGLR